MKPEDISPGLRAALDQDIHALLEQHPGLACESSPDDLCPGHAAVYWAIATVIEDVRAVSTAKLPDGVDLAEVADHDPELVVESLVEAVSRLAIWRAAIGTLTDDPTFRGLG